MRVLIVDGQGGGMGKALVEQLKQLCPTQPLLAVGTNALATAAMPVSRCQVTVAGCERLPATEAVALAAREAARRIREGQHQDEKT